MKRGFLQQSSLVVISLLALFGARLAHASEPVYLDPDAKPEPPPAEIGAYIAEETTGRACPARLMPNGVVVLARPCALEGRIGRARLWSKDADSISLLKDNGWLLFRFEAQGPRVYRTRDAKPPQLVLSLLPEASRPMGQ